MFDRCPRVGNIQKQSVCLVRMAFDGEAPFNNISPGRCDVVLVESLKELSSNFSSFFVELESV